MSSEQLAYFRDRLDEIERRGFLKGLIAAAGSVAVPKPVIAAIKAFPLTDVELIDQLVAASSSVVNKGDYPGIPSFSGLHSLMQTGILADKKIGFGSLSAFLSNEDKARFAQAANVDNFLDAWDKFGSKPRTAPEWLEVYSQISSEPLQIQKYLDIIQKTGRDPFNWLQNNQSTLHNLIGVMRNNAKEIYNSMQQAKAVQQKAEKQQASNKQTGNNQQDTLNTSGNVKGNFGPSWNVAAKDVNFNTK